MYYIVSQGWQKYGSLTGLPVFTGKLSLQCWGDLRFTVLDLPAPQGKGGKIIEAFVFLHLGSTCQYYCPNPQMSDQMFIC